MIRRFIRPLVTAHLAAPGVLVPVQRADTQCVVEWRLWEADGANGEPGAGWYKCTQEPFSPVKWETVAGLLGSGEQAALVNARFIYRHQQKRSYVAELGDCDTGFEPFGRDTRPLLLATGWAALPPEARWFSKPKKRLHLLDSDFEDPFA